MYIPFYIMNTLTFVGWVGDDALRVLKTHVPLAIKGIDDSKDPAVMQTYLEKMKEHVRVGKFKGLNPKIVKGVYILHLGKCIENLGEKDKLSVVEIPDDLTERRLAYISLIKEGKISRTKYPMMYNLMYEGQSVKSRGSASNKNGSKVDDEDSLDRTEAVNNIIKKKNTPKSTEESPKEQSKEPQPKESKETPKESSKETKKASEDDIEYSNVELPPKKGGKSSVEVDELDELDDDIDSEEPLVSSGKNKKQSKQIPINTKDKEEEPQQPEKSEKPEKNVTFDDEPPKETPKESSKGTSKEPPKETVSRKQRRKQLADPDEESRWEQV